MPIRNIKNKRHMLAMAKARSLRDVQGLEETFSEQTRLRSHIDGMQRFLKHNETADIPDALRQEIKERVQEVLAIEAEELYLLSQRPDVQT